MGTRRSLKSRRNRRDARARAPAAAPHALDRGQARSEEPVGPKREHVLHRDVHIAAFLKPGHLLAEALGVTPLPPKRRVHDDGLRAESLGGLNASVEFRDRVCSPHPLRDQQARRMD
jgi:hypothetical protein